MNTCDFPNCEGYVGPRAQLCKGHQQQRRSGHELKPLQNRNKGKLCKLSYCDKPAAGLGYCIGHWAQQHQGRELAPLQWSGKRGEGEFTLRSDGYVGKHGFNKAGVATTIWQHRQVMEEYIGRELVKGESVHHRNGDRSDNRLQNLELWSKAQPAGQRVEDKLEWAYAMIELYANYSPPVLID